ncbi:MAG TPA: AAA family ATPase [Acidimicrobiales bacterium]
MLSGACIVVTGPPGAGKTTIAPLVARRADPSVCLESDWFWTTIANGFVPPYRTEAHEQNATVVRAFAAAASALAAGGYTVVLEGIVGPWFLHLVVEECARHEVPLSYVVLRPSRAVALTRATSRVDEKRVPGHPPLTDGEVIGRMWDVFADLGDLEPLVIDNSALSASEAADRVWDRFVAGGLRLGEDDRQGGE